MPDNTKDRESALRSIADMRSRSENAQAKFAPGTSQHSLLKNRLHALSVAATLIQRDAAGSEGVGEHTMEDLEKAHAPLNSLIGKSEKARQKLAPDTWQHRVLTDNLKALHLAESLMVKAVGTLCGAQDERSE